ncbi:MAG TPA: hypothetical protein VN515_02330 [Terriglobales bacterium]|nr:hypothetical protein [Terriglobales bacterium]
MFKTSVFSVVLAAFLVSGLSAQRPSLQLEARVPDTAPLTPRPIAAPLPTPAPAPSPAPAPAPAPVAPSSAPSGQRFTAPAAQWLYSAPGGPGLNISGMASSLPFHVNTHADGFDFPVQYTDWSHGCTTFTDTRYYNYADRLCVPTPTAGYFTPSVGAWGANDGHLVIVDTVNHDYYEFWKLTVDNHGWPTSTNVGQIVEGNYTTGDGNPGTTAAGLTALAGVILPGELDCATCLNHALSVVVPGNMNSNQIGHQAPAHKTDGGSPGAIFREGAKIRFDPGVNVDNLNVSTAVKALMRALQNYGGVITDQTGGPGVSFYSSLATPPDLTGINQIGQHLFLYY